MTKKLVLALAIVSVLVGALASPDQVDAICPQPNWCCSYCATDHHCYDHPDCCAVCFYDFGGNWCSWTFNCWCCFGAGPGVF